MSMKTFFLLFLTNLKMRNTIFVLKICRILTAKNICLGFVTGE